MDKKHMMKTILKKLLPEYILDKLRMPPEYSNIYYSQNGEDILLSKILGDEKGFYIDIGAHHPKRFSNTYIFYKSGWNGINIDALPGSKKLFDKIRPRDTNIKAVISDKKQKVKYYMFNEPALNTISETEAEKTIKDGTYKIINTLELTTTTLKEVLDNNIPSNKKIDFMSIDVEGNDLNVLKSNDWRKYRPKFIFVESNRKNLEEILKSELNKFMIKVGYRIHSKLDNSILFEIN